MSNKGYMGKDTEYAKGGAGDSTVSRFLKTPDQFTDGRLPPSDKGGDDDPEQDYVKTGAGGKLSKTSGDTKCLKPIIPKS